MHRYDINILWKTWIVFLSDAFILNGIAIVLSYSILFKNCNNKYVNNDDFYFIFNLIHNCELLLNPK